MTLKEAGELDLWKSVITSSVLRYLQDHMLAFSSIDEETLPSSGNKNIGIQSKIDTYKAEHGGWCDFDQWLIFNSLFEVRRSLISI